MIIYTYTSPQIINGVTTYQKNFFDIILPHLFYPNEYIFSICDYLYPIDRNKYILNLHNRRFYNTSNLNEPKWGKQNLITHYKPLATFINEKTNHKGYFIPMSIDIREIPQTTNKNKKFIYFGNLFSPHKNTNFLLLKEYLGDKLDFISGMRFNNSKIIKSRQDLFSILSEYSYGFGVGRCAIEMLAAGLQVMVVGENFGGVINTLEEFNKHHETNFSSFFYRNFLNLDIELKKLTNSTFQVNLDDISMFTYLPYYMEVFETAINNI